MRGTGSFFQQVMGEENPINAIRDMFILMYFISRDKDIHKRITQKLLNLDQNCLKNSACKATDFEYIKQDDGSFLFDTGINWDYIAPLVKKYMIEGEEIYKNNSYMNNLKENEYIDFFKWLECEGEKDILEVVRELGL